MRSLNNDSAGIIFIDPPFNLRKNYCDTDKNIDCRPVKDYESWLLSLLSESIRVLMPGGALYLYHLPLWAMRLGAVLEKDLHFQHWIAIAMKNGFVRGPHLYPAHYALLFFTKGKPAYFNRPKLKPSICRHCGDLVKDYGGYRKIIEEKGINLSDFWEDLSPVRHNNRKHRSANELPETLFQRVFEISGCPGKLYVDPFAGAGSGVVSSAISGMTFEACDLMPDNCSIICQRLDDLKADILKR
jgi:site-specific DNA-methyltransferase (adenine-specific)